MVPLIVLVVLLGVLDLSMLLRGAHPGNRWPFRLAVAFSAVVVLPVLGALLMGRDTWNGLFANETAAGGIVLVWVLVVVPVASVVALVLTLLGLVRQRQA